MLTTTKIEKILGVSADLAIQRIRELTPRETQVADLATEGMSSRQIAEQLGISPKTVDVHRGKIFMKLGVKSVVDVVRYVLMKRLAEASRRA